VFDGPLIVTPRAWVVREVSGQVEVVQESCPPPEGDLRGVGHLAGLAESGDARLVVGHDQCRHRGDRTGRIDQSISGKVGEHRHRCGEAGKELSDRLWRRQGRSTRVFLHESTNPSAGASLMSHRDTWTGT
jgi:hypothetical protein